MNNRFKMILWVFMSVLVVSCTPNSRNNGEGDSKPAPSKVMTKSEATLELTDTLNLGEPPTKAFDYERFKVAIANDADVNARHANGMAVVYLATVANVELMDGHPDKPNLLEALRTLVNLGANVNVQQFGGSTALMHAVHRAHGAVGHPIPDFEEVFNILMSAKNPKIDLEVKNDWGQTALNYFLGYNELKYSKRLIEAGANFKTIDYDNATVIHDAVADIELFNYIMGLFTDEEKPKWTNIAEFSGRTPLMYAAQKGNAEIVEALLTKFGALTNAQDVEDATALSLAKDSLFVAESTGDIAKAEKVKSSIEVLLKHDAVEVLGNPDEITCSGPNTYPTSFDRIVKTIKKCAVNDIEALMPLLPRAYLSNYNLAFASQSLQEKNADITHPRIISMGKSGQTFLAFGGNQAKEGYNVLELIEFKKDLRKFEFREIDFNKSGESRFSEPNPKKCNSCHRESTPRPNWYNWTFWPGMYFGEQHSQFDQEKKFYAEFQKHIGDEKASGKGLYRHLLPYGKGTIMTNAGLIPYSALKNIKMDDVMSYYVGELIIGVMKSTPKLQPYKYAILAAMSCGDDIEGYLPTEIQNKLPRKYADILYEVKALNREEFELRLNLLKKFVPGAPYGQYIIDQAGDPDNYGGGRSFETIRMSKLRYIVEGLGVPMEWSTIPGSKNYYVMSHMTGLEMVLWKNWLSPEGAEAGVYAVYDTAYKTLKLTNMNYMFFRAPDDIGKGVADENLLCPELKKLSLQSLK